MTLVQRIAADLISALKNKEQERLSVLRMLKASLLITAKEKTNQTELADEVVLAVLKKEKKKRLESAEVFAQAKRQDLADKEKREAKIIQEYLPAEISDEIIQKATEEIILQIGKENFGAVMGAVMKKMQGRADGNRVKQIVQQCLAK
ncbi:MAG: hypothetical protein A2233_05405 [Candidatus Kerfeldbacteria bacterium RIFOXYA2_FULL_38_24]|uniref:Glutamyl-tRNA amidotransferase n=1 Tax=Candidatus Kerfeldbacteria bacterium RIFOXYB2_FULL_38_14 TaxID=1798547 RepID=A0A1G2BGG8_9BACT|nr:MAG: hypothetical protein A2233_05405 [Candidatus Kerfeldbacteria bacterium RIFOXYA2_FULL_38_24]OGY88264.1 MAG: hypothetical protein A2319_03695 [Candidatus Kerfeldbacteria bacterium RIFOXYB2_FULL_38_14]OGY89387.1 MAG: hypothetical protein A2458_04230 [Candidatus Kerfeldbacteria bacterium RIFOXYC2_FULL_38_9]